MPKKHHAYLVTWRDSSTLGGWRLIDDPLHYAVEIWSIGWLVRETKKDIMITTSVSQTGRACDVLAIPREAIVRMKKLPQFVEGE